MILSDTKQGDCSERIAAALFSHGDALRRLWAAPYDDHGVRPLFGEQPSRFPFSAEIVDHADDHRPDAAQGVAPPVAVYS